MSRFKFRDILWLTVLLGLAAAWWLEGSQRQRESAELKRLQVVVAEQVTDLNNAEQYVLDKDAKEGRHLLTDLAKRLEAKREAMPSKDGPAAALAGQWEVVELIGEGMVHHVEGEPAWIKIGKGRIAFGKPNGESELTCRCTINAREIDIVTSDLRSKRSDVIKGLYELKDGKLRIVWANDFNKPRPTDFDVSNNKQLMLYVLKKVK